MRLRLWICFVVAFTVALPVIAGVMVLMNEAVMLAPVNSTAPFSEREVRMTAGLAVPLLVALIFLRHLAHRTTERDGRRPEWPVTHISFGDGWWHGTAMPWLRSAGRRAGQGLLAFAGLVGAVLVLSAIWSFEIIVRPQMADLLTTLSVSQRVGILLLLGLVLALVVGISSHAQRHTQDG